MSEPVYDFPFTLGQVVRRVDSSDCGTVIGAVLGEIGKAIVRWPDGLRFERVEDLVALMSNPAA
jgi:hypothetical protein